MRVGIRTYRSKLRSLVIIFSLCLIYSVGSIILSLGITAESNASTFAIVACAVFGILAICALVSIVSLRTQYIAETKLQELKEKRKEELARDTRPASGS